MVHQAIIKRLMKLREFRLQCDVESGAIFQEVFNNPEYLNLTEAAKLELGLEWARSLYQHEVDAPSIEEPFGEIDLSRFCRNRVILDVGCYLGGKTIRWLEKYLGDEIHGVDINSRFIQIAKCFAKERNANAHFKLNFAEQLDFPDESFDVILTSHTFEHVTDIDKAMQECHRVLRKHGVMVAVFPSFWGLTNHHLDLVTRTPFLHWFFPYPKLLQAYFAVLDERGDEALWYRRQQEYPLPFEKGYSINGTDARAFRRLLKDRWHILCDGFLQDTGSRSGFKKIVKRYIKLSRLPIARELFPIAYVLKKRPAF
jgi:ubiquinone/menaquinone biosynthesis C-methylase UbiE